MVQNIPRVPLAGLTSVYPMFDYVDFYKGVMKFEKNKEETIHKWYPFVEGYAKEFIQSIIDELDYTPTHCLDPFVGSGTTPLHLQNLDIKCTSFEVSPFMHLLSITKMQQGHQYQGIEHSFIQLQSSLRSCIGKKPKFDPPIGETLVESASLKRWIFDKKVMEGILDVKYAISMENSVALKNLFNLALASILVPASNVYRNGKCLSYRKNWESLPKLRREDVHERFLTKLEEDILPDIIALKNVERKHIDNQSLCVLGDSRKLVQTIPNGSLDLLISSPPYLNSRDYTDIYRLELWVLDLIRDYDGFLNLRKDTLISHVQVKHPDVYVPYVAKLSKVLSELESVEGLWSSDIPAMVKGYFSDLHWMLMSLKQKFQRGKRAFVNVANSAYAGIEIEVDMILAEIAELNGFEVLEIRKARDLSPSAHQKDKVGKLRETVIVLGS